jgi:hypothetical protein
LEPSIRHGPDFSASAGVPFEVREAIAEDVGGPFFALIEQFAVVRGAKFGLYFWYF